VFIVSATAHFTDAIEKTIKSTTAEGKAKQPNP
jgi:hypothetical protein